jgi:hypothetical protein
MPLQANGQGIWRTLAQDSTDNRRRKDYGWMGTVDSDGICCSVHYFNGEDDEVTDCLKIQTVSQRLDPGRVLAGLENETREHDLLQNSA